MLNEIVGRFLKTSEGGGLVKDLRAKGLTEQEATSAVTATAEGAMTQDDPAAGDGGALGGITALLGGQGGGALGGLPGRAPAAAPPAAQPGAPAPAAQISPIAQMVASKTGLTPAMAQMVVNTALPKIMGLLGLDEAPAAGAPAAGAPVSADAKPPAAGGSLTDVLGSLLR